MIMDKVIALVLLVTSGLLVSLSFVLGSRTFEMDTSGPGAGRHSFHALFAIYRKIYAGIFVAGTLLPVLMPASGDVDVFRMLLDLSAVYALFMVLWTAFQYEIYQHLRYLPGIQARSPYKGWKYAVTLTLGIMSPLLFAIGLIGIYHGQ